MTIEHGAREGAADYVDRFNDVASGLQPETWAWPLVSADEQYINAVGTSAICRAVGVPDFAWNDICTAWCEAFCRGYRAAHSQEIE